MLHYTFGRCASFTCSQGSAGREIYNIVLSVTGCRAFTMFSAFQLTFVFKAVTEISRHPRTSLSGSVRCPVEQYLAWAAGPPARPFLLQGSSRGARRRCVPTMSHGVSRRTLSGNGIKLPLALLSCASCLICSFIAHWPVLVVSSNILHSQCG